MRLESQSYDPGKHVHRPALQAFIVPGALTHEALHAPQWAAVVEKLVSQPLVTLPSQSPKPASHVS